MGRYVENLSSLPIEVEVFVQLGICSIYTVGLRKGMEQMDKFTDRLILV
jgi:hypothetical protein